MATAAPSTFTITITSTSLAIGTATGCFTYTTLSSSGAAAASIAESALGVVNKVVQVGVHIVAGSIAAAFAEKLGSMAIRRVGDGIRTTSGTTAIAAAALIGTGTTLTIMVSGQILTRLATGGLIVTSAAFAKIREALHYSVPLTEKDLDIVVTTDGIYVTDTNPDAEDYVVIDKESC